MIRKSILLAAVFFAGAAHAEEQCALHQLGSLDLKQLDDGSLTIPVTIAGKQQRMRVSTSAPFSYIYAEYGDAEKFPVQKLPSKVTVHIDHQTSKELYKVSSLVMGNAGGNDLQLVRVEGSPKAGGEAVGEIALDLLAGFDVEVDLKNAKMILFSQDHCAGQAVYWAKSYASLPFKTDASGHTNFNMTLDGKDLTVAIDLSPHHGVMGMKTAKRIFDLEENSYGMSLVENLPANAPKVYRYPFKSLSVAGVSIANPKIFIVPQSDECRTDLHLSAEATYQRCYGASDLNIGLAEVLQLHLYFAFKEKMLYVTAADAH